MPFFRVPVHYYVEADNIDVAAYVITNFVYDDPQLPMLAYRGVTIVDVEQEQAEEVPPDVMEKIRNK